LSTIRIHESIHPKIHVDAATGAGDRGRVRLLGTITENKQSECKNSRQDPGVLAILHEIIPCEK
jgi:hypothetical protein